LQAPQTHTSSPFFVCSHLIRFKTLHLHSIFYQLPLFLPFQNHSMISDSTHEYFWEQFCYTQHLWSKIKGILDFESTYVVYWYRCVFGFHSTTSLLSVQNTHLQASIVVDSNGGDKRNMSSNNYTHVSQNQEDINNYISTSYQQESYPFVDSVTKSLTLPPL
ncbi:hypothetical protein R6Q59_006891, partial [Mikania micrantha]